MKLLFQASGNFKTDGSETGQVEVNVEGQQYVEAKSYIMIEIVLRKPLVPKRPPEELARRYCIIKPVYKSGSLSFLL